MIDDSIATRLDLVTFVQTLPCTDDKRCDRHRLIAVALVLGYTQIEIARALEISPPRVSQIRSEILRKWLVYSQGES